MNIFKIKRQKTGLGSLVIFLGMGVVFIVPGYAIYSSSQPDPNWVKVEGSVIGNSSSISDGSTMYTPIVEYTAQGRKLQTTANMSSSSPAQIGGKREVSYDPTQPHVAKVTSSGMELLFVALFPIIGVLIIVIGLVSFVRSVKRTNEIKHLMNSGFKLQGIVTDIRASSVSRNNKSSSIVVVSAVDHTGAVRHFGSDALTGINRIALSGFQNDPIPVDVYIDMNSTEKYYVDIDDLPDLTSDKIAELLKGVASPGGAAAVENISTPPINGVSPIAAKTPVVPGPSVASSSVPQTPAPHDIHDSAIGR